MILKNNWNTSISQYKTKNTKSNPNCSANWFVSSKKKNENPNFPSNSPIPTPISYSHEKSLTQFSNSAVSKMSHHNGGPGPSPVKLEPKLEPIGNGHAVAMTGNLLTTRQRLRLIPNKEHKPDGYEDLQLDFSPSIFSSLERYLPPNMLAVARDDKAKFMRDILLKYLPTGERNKVCFHCLFISLIIRYAFIFVFMILNSFLRCLCFECLLARWN